MSTSVEARKRPNIWSYISFGSGTRHRSSSLPTRSPIDPHEKADRHANHYSGSSARGETYGSTHMSMSQSARSRYIKTLGVLFFIVCIFLWLAPKERAKVEDLVGDYGHYNPFKAPASGPGGCTKPHSSDKPLIQYALMIDAGSTGSRIHVYRFNNCKATPELEHEDFKMTEKRKEGSGLSSYGDDPEAAARSLDPLMDLAMSVVPDEYKQCSPVAVKATAGLRLLGEEKSERILAAVRKHLDEDFPFPVVSKENHGVAVMDGKDEGVYAWITLNYLLGTIGERAKTPTAAVFDLGGGSTQIVFEPTFAAPTQLEEGDHKYKLTFGGRAFELYQHSHLKYGLMQARAQVHAAVASAKKAAHAAHDPAWADRPLEHPCVPPNMTSPPIDVTLDDGAKHRLHMTGSAPSTAPGGGGGTTAAQCRALAERILHKDASCTLAPCSFNGVHQPSLARTFAREDVYLFSYFYDRLQLLGMPASFSLRELRDVTARVCEGEASWAPFDMVEGAMKELRERTEYCLDLNFIMALLHTGYEMPIDREVRIAKQMKGNELGWCLGASLPLLSQESGWTCKIRKVGR